MRISHDAIALILSSHTQSIQAYRIPDLRYALNPWPYVSKHSNVRFGEKVGFP